MALTHTSSKMSRAASSFHSGVLSRTGEVRLTGNLTTGSLIASSIGAGTTEVDCVLEKAELQEGIGLTIYSATLRHRILALKKGP
jgi:hypothetical protein